MFNGHFYHGILRKSVAVFGTLFNNINIIRDHRGEGKVIKVPLAYGPKQKFLARIDEQPNLNDTKVAIKLPRMSFEITSLEYDSATVHNRHNQLRADTYNTVDSVPYLIGMDLTIMAKNQDEGLQILEQIVPTFKPEYTVSVNLVDSMGSVDVPIVLNSVSISDSYEGDFESRRVLTYTLSFTMRTRFFGNVDTRTSVIKSALVSLQQEDPDRFFENVKVEVDPLTAEETDSYTIETNFNFVPPSNRILLDTTQAESFTVGETIVGDTSGSAGVVEEITNSYVKVKNLDGFFTIGETVTGILSEHTLVISSYTVER